MQTTFRNPTDVNGLIAVVELVEYKERPYVNTNREYVKHIIKTETIEVPLTPQLLTHDTIRWTGHYLNLSLLAKEATKNKLGYFGTTLQAIKKATE